MIILQINGQEYAARNHKEALHIMEQEKAYKAQATYTFFGAAAFQTTVTLDDLDAVIADEEMEL